MPASVRWKFRERLRFSHFSQVGRIHDFMHVENSEPCAHWKHKER